MDWQAGWVTFKLAAGTTLALLVLGVPLAYWLSATRSRLRPVVEVAVALPLVLPPTVLGFYFLMASGSVGVPLPFTFAGVLIASVLFNLPFAVRPFAAAFAAVDRRLVEASWCLGVSRIETFVRIILPLAWPGVLAGLALTFAHTVGEFGVVLMVGGNIPGATRTLSVAVYDDVQALDYATAGQTAFALVTFAAIVLGFVHALQRRVTR